MQINRSILIATEIWDELDSYDKNLKSKFIRAFRFLSRDVRHPSLRIEDAVIDSHSTMLSL
ncbi:MAG: hypothetical protein ABSB82_01440 [Terriglobia bacterium]|jgi:hypothetical protein